MRKKLSFLILIVMISGIFPGISLNSVSADSSLVLWYKFNESSGANVADSSGYGRNGTLIGGADWSDGNGIQLDGYSGYVTMPSGILSGLNNITVSTKVLVDSSISYPSWIFSFGNTSDSYNNENANYFGLLLNADNYRVVLSKTRWSNEQNTKCSTALSSGVWKYITYTQNGRTGTLYIDGVQVAQNSNISYDPSDIENNVANFIGRAPYTADRYFNGRISDFRVYNRALSKSEILDIVNSNAAQSVSLDKAALSLGDLNSVTANIDLPTNGDNGSTISWASSNSSVISSSGVVIRPQYPSGNKTVTLTATISMGSISDSKTFVANVIALGQFQDPVIESAKNRISIANSEDVRGNITLPAKVVVEGKTVNISWTCDRPDVVNTKEIINYNYDNTPPGVVTRQSTDTVVTLTAYLTYGASNDTVDIPIKVKAKPISIGEADFKGYFFTYFSGANRSDAEQIFFSLSTDGLHWTGLNKNNPVMGSKVGDKGVRDPYILRSPEGDKFYMVATDLRIANGAGWDAAQRAGSKSIVVWESNDLVNWSKERLVKVARDDAGCTWAPEVVYDDKTGEYVVFWASKVAQDNYSKHRIYIAKTRDFYTFTEPVVWIDRQQDVIDTDVIKHNGMYYRFSKDEVNKNIIIDKCDQLLNKTYETVSSTSVGSLKGVEGPAIFKFNGQNRWCLLLDDYSGGGYFPMVSDNIASGVFAKLSTSQYLLPSGARHGTVMQITQAEYDAVMAKWSGEKPQTEGIKIISAKEVIVKRKSGQDVDLPSRIDVKFSNGTSGTARVEWDSISPQVLSQSGTITVGGTLYDNEYDNPLILNRADPFIYKHSDGYYYFTASYTDASNGHNNVGMYQYDRLILRKAKTIEGLATAEEKVIYTKAPLEGNKSPHVWAPEIHYIDGDWYIYYATTISSTDVWQVRPHVLKCPGNLDPMIRGNWQDKGQMQKTNSSDMAFKGFSLDATTFEHRGIRYLVWAQNDPSSNLYIARMKDPLTIDTNAVKIATPIYDWEKHVYQVNEGAAVIKRNGKIFISYSASATDANYCMGLLTASENSDLLNPDSWVKTSVPIMRTNVTAGQYGPGHNSFTVSEDGEDDLIVYHARREEKYISGSYEPLYDAGRHTRIQKLYWNEDGTPNFGTPFADGKVLSSVKATARIEEEISTGKIGDVNCNGKVDSTDYAMLKRHLLGIITLSGDAYVNADTNRDGKVNSTDYALLKKFLLGIVSSL